MTSADARAPSGDVTFLFTDLEGSTALWEREPEAMDAALAEHDRRLREVMADHRGYIFTTAGDSFAVAFDSPHDALAAAIETQRRLLEPCGDITIKIRMGLHTGAATARDDDYFGAVVNRAARLMSSAHGGQIILSGATAKLVEPQLPADTTLVDFGEHRLKDLLRPEHIFQIRHPDLADGFPPLRTLEGPSIKLPPQLTSFVGREQELADVGELLREHRLVTMVGAGGSGKTRLALQVAADSLEFFPDGIRFVELAAVADAQFICDEIAVAIGAREMPETDFIDTITAKIGAQRMLLVLDNCEHLIDDVAPVVDQLLRACDGLKLLATSRERLNSSGEVAYRVPSLSTPALAAPAGTGRGLPHWVKPTARPRSTDLRVVRNTDSVRLFTERAMLARADFELTAENVDAVVAICVRLDGIPLALELAAARLRALSPEQIASRLDERFRLLAGSSRGALERHRTLAATIDWSYEHLSAPEQAVFRRASVFSGTFDILAAEHVCVGDDVDALDVLDHVEALLDKSMLVPEDRGDGATWYRLLESMRHYGASKVSEHDEDEAVAMAHTSFYVTRCAELEQMWRGDRLAEALVALDRDIENVRAALRHAIDHHHNVEAARIISSIGYLWYASGTFVEGIDWCHELFEDEPELPDEVLAATLHAYSLLLGSWSNPEAGATMLMREVEIRRRIGDPGRLAAALNNLGNLLNDLGRADEGETTLLEAVEQYRLAGEPATLALATLGFGHKDAGRYDEAAALFTEALEEAAAAGNPYGVALGQSGLGELNVHRGKTKEARALLEDARGEFDSLGVRPGVNNIDLIIAIADIADGEIVDAARRLSAALAEPDAHWYQAAKYWILQLAASLVDDRTLASRLLAVASRYYQASDIAQPLWVVDHLDVTRRRIAEHADVAAETAAVLDIHDAIAAADDALQQIAGDAPDRRGRESASID